MLGEHKLRRFNNEELKQILELHSSQALSKHSPADIPAGVTGFDNGITRILTSAMTIQKAPITDIYTSSIDVYKVYLDTKFDTQTFRQIQDAGFSRIPVAYSKTQPVVIGMLLVKTVLAVNPNERTIGQLAQEGELQLKVPLFVSQDDSLQKVHDSFKEGKSHMGIVCKDRNTAAAFASFCDDFHSNLATHLQSLGDETTLEVDAAHIFGVLTLEDVIERTINYDIADEQDREDAVEAMQMRTQDSLNTLGADPSKFMQHRYQQDEATED